MPSWLATLALSTTLGIATVTDIRSRTVPRWLSLGSIITGLIVAMSGGPDPLLRSVVGLLVGGLLLLPFVLRGGFGLADALLLAAIGTWQGWQFVLYVAWWMALVGGVLAVIAWRRERAVFPYVPAVMVGWILALLRP